MNQMARIEADTGQGTQATCNLCGGSEHTFHYRKAGFDLVRCSGCSLAFIANPPDMEAVSNLYSTSDGYHTGLVNPGDSDWARMQAISEQHLRVLSKTIPNGKGLKLLDMGCSSGQFLNAARGAGYEVQGLELSPHSSQFARDHFGLPVYTGLLESAGFEPGSFDVITLFDVIEHMPDPLAHLHAAFDLLKPGGVLLQSTPNIDGLFPKLSYAVADLFGYWQHPEPPHHLFQFSVKTLSDMTAKAGFIPGRVDQSRIDLSYSFGTMADWKASKMLFPYAMLFAPVSVIGSWIGMGDWFYLAARKPG
ncbi:MAG: class I SAM-dependent methyltransferase [Sphingomonadaceae bacterium]|nr:class I SAM-dependent methyltransferase [Sphingomonadaceae bacterium]